MPPSSVTCPAAPRPLLVLVSLAITVGAPACTAVIDGDQGDYLEDTSTRETASLRLGDRARVCQAAWLRQRSGPGMAHPTLQFVSSGTELSILQGSGGWYQYTLAGLTGWSWGGYLCPASSTSPATPTSPTAPPTAPSSPTAPPTAPSSPPAPAGSGTLTVSQILGGASFSLAQGYGTVQVDRGYGYCHSFGSWGAGTIVHCGLDLGIPRGTPLHAPVSGTVLVAGGSTVYKDQLNPGAGELRLRRADGAIVILGHLAAVAVGQGQTVAAGAVVGQSGQSGGFSHLHLEVRVPDASCAAGLCTRDPAGYFGL